MAKKEAGVPATLEPPSPGSSLSKRKEALQRRREGSHFETGTLLDKVPVSDLCEELVSEWTVLNRTT